MFARRYFPGRYFAPRFFPQSQGQVAVVYAGRIEYTAAKSVIDYTAEQTRIDYTATPQRLDWRAKQ